MDFRLSRLSMLCLAFAVLAGGCRTGRYELTDAVDGQTLEVKSGDRVSILLDENATTGYVWMTECDDPDITFVRETIPPDDDTLMGAPGKVRIIMRVARGFDGPAHVKLVCRRPWKGGGTARQIDVILYHKAEDNAPWKKYF